MTEYSQQFTQFLRRLPPSQKLALFVVLVGGIASFTGIAYWASRPDYALLFGNLKPTEASRTVDALSDKGVKYELRQSGTAVYVPREKVYELRMNLMGQGIISDGPLGDKIFDQNTLGMTNFMQKVNLRRALEGELARTIASLNQVEQARVHLVIPEKRAFSRKQNQPTASVVLHLTGREALSENQIIGISSLVAGAVEGLTSDEVTLLDTRGKLLSNPKQGDTNAMLTANQQQMQLAKEEHLTEQAQSMLDQVLGQHNSIVRVSATLDFTKSVVESKNIDPESATVISEEKLEENNDPQSNANSTVKNYELSEKREHSEKSVGEVSYLTVSVILNQRTTPPAAGAKSEPVPFSTSELAEVESLVKNAVGFREHRGDKFAIHQTVFDPGPVQPEVLAQPFFNEDIQIYIRYGLIAVALIMALLLIRSASKQAVKLSASASTRSTMAGSNSLQNHDHGSLQGGPQNANHLLDRPEPESHFYADDLYESKLSGEAKARLKAKHQLFDEIKNQITSSPEDTADLIRSWVAQDIERAEPATS